MVLQRIRTRLRASALPVALLCLLMAAAWAGVAWAQPAGGTSTGATIPVPIEWIAPLVTGLVGAGVGRFWGGKGDKTEPVDVEKRIREALEADRAARAEQARYDGLTADVARIDVAVKSLQQAMESGLGKLIAEAQQGGGPHAGP